MLTGTAEQTFVKEPVAITFFAARHTKDSATWLEEGSSFAVLDAAEEGVSIVCSRSSSRHTILAPWRVDQG